MKGELNSSARAPNSYIADAERNNVRGIGYWLIMAYIWEVVLFKSRFLAMWKFSWPLHMALSAFMPALIVLYYLSRPKAIFLPKAVRLRAFVTMVCTAIMVWGVLGAIFSDFVFEELGFVLIWFAMVLASWHAAPLLTLGADPERLIRQIALPLRLGIIISILWLFGGPAYDPFTRRFAGIFYTNPTMAEVSVTGTIVFFALLMGSRGRRRLFDLSFVVAALFCVLLTRCRGAIIEVLMAIGVMLLVQPRFLSRFFTASVVTICGLFLLVFLANLKQQERELVMDFFRLENSIEANAGKRMTGYIRGVNAVKESPIFGKGFTSRYAGGGINLEARLERDVTAAYNWIDDPHIMVLTLGKSIGVPGLILGVLLLIGIANVGKLSIFYGEPPALTARFLLVGMVVYVLVHSLFGNGLLSFGAIIDRFMWIIIGIFSGRAGYARDKLDKGAAATGPTAAIHVDSPPGE